MTKRPLNLFERPPTARQTEIARTVEECGGSLTLAAAKLGIHINTVKNAIGIYRIKTGLRERGGGRK